MSPRLGQRNHRAYRENGISFDGSPKGSHFLELEKDALQRVAFPQESQVFFT